MIDRINDELKQAMKQKNNTRVQALRNIKNTLNSAGEKDPVEVLQKLSDKYQESIKQYQQAERTDLVTNEQAELDVINEFLPEQKSEAEIEKIIDQIISDLGATQMSDMKHVMNEAKNQLAGQADNKTIANIAKSKLQ